MSEIDNLEQLEISEKGGVILDPPPKKQSIQYIHHCFTWNNYIEEDIETLETFFKEFAHKYCFQAEIGEKGTPHLQGTISLKKKMRYTEFGLPKQIHWEKVINVTKSYLYSCKRDTQVKGPWFMNYVIPENLDIIENLYPWQADLEKIIKEPADKRIVHWYWENTGNAGKSSFCKYLCHKYKAIYIDEGKKADVINLIYKCKEINSHSIICIDIPRSNGNKITYKAIEQIKNGMICNMKYETGMKLFNSPHIIIFSNEEPDKSKLSEDRWNIIKIE